MMAWARSAFSEVNTNGVSALFSGVSLWITRVSCLRQVVVERDLVAVLANPDKTVLTNIMVFDLL